MGSGKEDLKIEWPFTLILFYPFGRFPTRVAVEMFL
jgi:hypothetical protein